jgi:hypothetical protein
VAYWLAAAFGFAVQAAPAPMAAWVQRFNLPQSDQALPQGLAVGSLGITYVTGSWGWSNFVTVAYSGQGIPLWTNFHGGRNNGNYGSSVAADPASGNVYITADFDILCYDKAGTPLWTNRLDAYACAMLVGSNGNVYVCGSQGLNPVAWATITAYAPGGLPLWTNRFGQPTMGANVAWSMTIAGESLCVAGGTAAGGTSWDFLTIAYSFSGAILWSNRCRAPTNGVCVAQAVTADDQANVFVAGYTPTGNCTVAYSPAGQALWTNLALLTGTYPPMAASRGRLFVATADSITCLGTAGGTVWTNNFPGRAGALTLNGRGDVLVAGTSSLPAGATEDFMIIAYSTDGLPLWTNLYDGPARGSDEISGSQCLALDPDGDFFVTGRSEGVHGGVTNYDFATIKYVPVPDIRFTSIQRQSDATIRLTINAPSNTPYHLQASPDLINWLTLTDFVPNLPPSVTYTDRLAPGFLQRAYRTLWHP